MLIILRRSLFDCDYESLVKLARKMVEKRVNVAILHIQDASMAVTLDTYLREFLPSGIKIYVLREDCEVRGLLHKVKDGVRTVDYRGWVDLVMNRHDKVVFWT
ncbi:MAG: sulfurtransferase complex subunit TusB [Candidatus Bathyarchaeota archaeon]|nr:sulfurtransferase complex subunit TusB [Candidatus Bathyarchaeota archaeon]MDH5733612.1 sulfurtransferase complex subunit TusB [Candidatus Bathyarchaeota archaeon]